jgi:hypothetical protein
MQTPPPPPNDPFSPLIEAWQQAFLKTLHDPQAAEGLWRGWNQLAGQWANASYTSSAPYGSAAASSTAESAPSADAAPSAIGMAEFLELARRIEHLEQRIASLEARLAAGDIP